MPQDARNLLAEAIETDERFPSVSNEVKVHQEMDAYNEELASQVPATQQYVAGAMANIMTRLESAIAFQSWPNAKDALEMLTDLHREVRNLGFSGGPR